MDLSVVVPTLNGRDRLAASLDSLAERAPDAEVIVVNGPSADGTTGMVRDRTDVDVLVELSDRNVNAARNAGIESATGDAVAFLGYDLAVREDWIDTVERGLARADAVTGPTERPGDARRSVTEPERRTIRDRRVSYFAGDNVAFRPSALSALDGFDEYLETGGARDAAHRLAALDREVAWEPGLVASQRRVEAADGGTDERHWGWKYRALAYRLVKNYGPYPTVARRLATHAGSDAVAGATDVVRGGSDPTAWLGTGRAVVSGLATGAVDGRAARLRDRRPRRNPNGVSARTDRAVARYDWR
jgi:glycosyltransferase involved in cell wall biosynthesis